MLRIFSLVTLVVCAQALPALVDHELIDAQASARTFNTRARLARDGYHSESHHVMTSDGYILEINRIPYRRFETKLTAGNASKPVVFLMHGLQGSSMSFIHLGPHGSLGYLLADDGYDVWMGNARGGLNSRRHIKWDPDQDLVKFFDYSFEDIGMKDLPAMIDYILRVTGRSQLHYIGHSQGGTSFLVLNSMLPEYNNKFASANLLAGVGYMENFPDRILSAIATITDPIYKYALRNGLLEILGPNTFSSLVNDCNSGKVEACNLIRLGQILGFLFKTEIIAGASVKQYAHFGQNIMSKTFRRWNFGPFANLLKYGSVTPPTYDISKITVDVTMHYTVSDNLLDEQDVLKMASTLPNARARKVAREDYTHIDFVVAPDSKELIYDYILEELNKKR